MTITVYGIPAPQGSKRHIGKGVMIESSKAVKPWREAVCHAAIEAMGGAAAQKITGPVKLSVTFTLKRPKSAKKGAVPDKKPDIDKLLRSTCDALTSAGVWEDDSRVIGVRANKSYVGAYDALAVPGAVIVVREAA